MVLLVSPSAKVTGMAVALKSEPAVAVPLPGISCTVTSPAEPKLRESVIDRLVPSLATYSALAKAMVPGDGR